jgi:hypothetical protein
MRGTSTVTLILLSIATLAFFAASAESSDPAAPPVDKAAMNDILAKNGYGAKPDGSVEHKGYGGGEGGKDGAPGGYGGGKDGEPGGYGGDGKGGGYGGADGGAGGYGGEGKDGMQDGYKQQIGGMVHKKMDPDADKPLCPEPTQEDSEPKVMSFKEGFQVPPPLHRAPPVRRPPFTPPRSEERGGSVCER